MKILTGKVLSTKMAKTAVVAVERVVAHAVYSKHFKVTKKYAVHDEIGVVVGQNVRFAASKPYSKLKRWKVIEIVDTQKEVKSKEDKSGKEVGESKK